MSSKIDGPNAGEEVMADQLNSKRQIAEAQVSQRRLVERLTGWRIMAFFVSAAINFGFLAGLIWLPLLLNELRLFIVVAWVVAAHAVFLVTVAGFRFPVSLKIGLAMAHAVACLYALGSVQGLPIVELGELDVSTMYLIPMMTGVVMVGGIVFAQYHGHKCNTGSFSSGGFLLFVTALALLIPIVQQIIPESYLTRFDTWEAVKAAVPFAFVSAVWCLIVANLYLRFLPHASRGMKPLQIAVGLFLLNAMVSWNHCQFGSLVAIWMVLSLIPIIGIVKNPLAPEVEST